MTQQKEYPPYALAIAGAEERFTSIAKHDGSLLNFKKEAEFALQIVKASEKLMKCSPASIRDSIINIASTGLSLNPALQHVYLIPWGGVCSAMVSYRGIAHLALTAKAIQWVQADEVFEKDDFTMVRGTHPRLEHTRAKGARGDLIGAYAVWKTTEGDVLSEFMTAEELKKVHEASKAPDSPAWKKWKGEMHKKAVIKRASKLWHKSPALASQIATIHRLDGDGYGDELKAKTNNPQENVTLDGQARSVVSPEQEAEINAAIDSPKLLDKILEAYNSDFINQLPADSFDEIMERIEHFKAVRAKATTPAAAKPINSRSKPNGNSSRKAA